MTLEEKRARIKLGAKVKFIVSWGDVPVGTIGKIVYYEPFKELIITAPPLSERDGWNISDTLLRRIIFLEEDYSYISYDYKNKLVRK